MRQSAVDEYILYPCPFCDGEAMLVEMYDNSRFGYYIKCKECWANSTGFRTKDEAQDAWNKRIYPVSKITGRYKGA